MRKQEFESRKKVQRKRNRVFVGIVLVTIILIVIPLGTYFVADKAVTDAVNVLQVEEGGIIRQSPYDNTSFRDGFMYRLISSYAEYRNYITIKNLANLSLTLDINVTAYITKDTLQSVKYTIGSVAFENKSVMGDESIVIPVDFNITSTDIVDILKSRSTKFALWSVKITATGSYLFWRIAKQKTYELTTLLPIYL